jgi:signal peptidase II
MISAFSLAETPAGRSPRAWRLLVLVLLLGLAADLGTKSWSYRHVAAEPVHLDRARLMSDPGHDPIVRHDGKPLLPGGLLELKLVLNPGAVFGIAAHQRWFFIAFTLVTLAGGFVAFARYTCRTHAVAHVAIGLVIAGGLGNLYDRIAFGRVRDFLHMMAGRHLPWDWTWPGTNNPELMPWVFNVADILLLAGMVLLMVHVNRQEKRRKGRTREPENSRARGRELESLRTREPEEKS